jgi:hypothetical protein
MGALLAFVHDPAVRPWLIALVVLVDLLALLAIAASRAHASKVKVIWAVIVLVIPVGGALAWLAIGRERRGRR